MTGERSRVYSSVGDERGGGSEQKDGYIRELVARLVQQLPIIS